jgi:hypothetical protein
VDVADAICRGGAQHREILQVVRARISVAGVVGRDAVVPQIDPEAAVAVDGVAEERVAGARRRPRADPVAADVVGDQVPGAGGDPADGVVRGVEGDGDSAGGVADPCRAGRVRPDEVPGDDVVRGVQVVDPHSLAAVAGEHVAPRRPSPDGVARGRGVDVDAVLGVGEGGRARRVRADVVALDEADLGRRAAQP